MSKLETVQTTATEKHIPSTPNESAMNTAPVSESTPPVGSGIVKERLSEKSLESAKSLDMIRNILFGEQARETERKHASLERFIRVSLNAMNEDMEKKVADINHELALLKDRLNDETQARREDASGAREWIAKVERHSDEVEQALVKETDVLGKRMESWRKDILERLEQTANQLRNEKADRKVVADVLNTMANQLFSNDEKRN